MAYEAPGLPAGQARAGVRISGWLIGGRETPTDSHVNVYYGACSHISAFHTFRNFNEFSFVRQVPEDVRLWQLNEKHMKGKPRRSS